MTRRIVSGCAALRGLDSCQQLVELGGRVAQVGLQDDADRGTVAKLRLGEQLEEQLERRLASVDRLHVDVQMSAELARALQQRSQALGRVVDPAPRMLGADQRRQRGDLDREVGPRQRPALVAIEQRMLRDSFAAASASTSSASVQRAA